MCILQDGIQIENQVHNYNFSVDKLTAIKLKTTNEMATNKSINNTVMINKHAIVHLHNMLCRKGMEQWLYQTRR